MKRRVYVHLLLAGAIIGSLFISFLPITTASADSLSGTNITTSPVSTVLKVKPGQSTSTTISVQNNASKPVTIQLQLQTFKPYGNTGRAQIVPPPADAPFISWAHFSQSNFVAQPGVWTQVKLTISTPPTAALDYYYAILVKPEVTTNATGTQQPTTTVKGYNAILILLDATTPGEKPSIAVTNFKTNHGIYEYLPVSFSATVKNTGNVFLAPTGDVYVSKDAKFHDLIDTIPINGAQGNVIPDSSRIFTEQWADGFPVFVQKTVDGQPLTDKSGNPIEQLQWSFSQANKFRFGHYYAKMVLAYSNGSVDIPTTSVISFWVIPWKILTAVSLLLILLLIGIYVIGRKVAKRTFTLSKKMRRNGNES